MRVIWIDLRYHNPETIETAWIQVGVEDRGGTMGRNRLGTTCFTVNQIRGFHDTKCVFQCCLLYTSDAADE